MTPEHARIRALFAAVGGTAKPSGAGGGDLAVGLLPESADREAVLAAVREAGFSPVALAISDDGAMSERELTP